LACAAITALMALASAADQGPPAANPAATPPVPVLDVAKLQPGELIGDPSFRNPGRVLRLEAIDGGRAILASSFYGTTCIWDAATGKALNRYGSAANPSTLMWALPDGRRLMAWERDTTDQRIMLIDRQTGGLLVTMKQDPKPDRKHPGRICALALTPEQKRIFALTNEGRITQWDTETGERVATWTIPQRPARCLAAAPDGKTLVSGGEDGSIAVWDAATGRLLRRLTGHGGFVADLVVAPDSTRFASTSPDKTVRLWDAQQGKELWNSSLPDEGSQVRFSPDGQTLAVTCKVEGRVHMLGAADGKERLVIDTTCGAYRARGPFGFGAEGTDVFVALGNTICRWDTRTGARLFPPAEAGAHVALDEVACLAVSPAGRRLYTLGGWWEAPVLVWDAAAKRVLDVRPLPPGQDHPISLQLSSDGTDLLVGMRYSGAVICDADTGRNRVSFPVHPRETYSSGDLWFWTRGDRAVVCVPYTQALAIYDLKGGDPCVAGEARYHGMARAVSADGQWAVLKESTRGVVIWDLLDAKPVMPLEVNGPSYAAFLPGGAKLLIASDDGLTLWDAAPPRHPGATPEQLAHWVSALGAADFRVRDTATAQLIDSGSAAGNALASADLHDPEVVDRAAKIRSAWKKRGAANHMVGAGLDLQGYLRLLVTHPDGSHWAALVGAGATPEIVLGDVTDQGPRALRRLNDDHGARSLAFSADGKTLYVGNGDATISVWRGGE
jgi:WD40 repeat protein